MEHTNSKVIRIASDAPGAIYGHLSDGVIVADENDVILYGNPAAEQAVGGGRSLTGRMLNDVIPASSVHAVDGETRASLSAVQITFQPACEPSGDAHWPDAFRHPMLLDGEKRASAILFRVRPNRVANEDFDADPEKNHLLLAIANNLPLGIYIQDVDHDFRLIRANRSFAQTFNADHATIRGKTPADIMPPEVAAAWRTQSGETIRNNGLVHSYHLQKQDAGGFPQFVHFTESLYVDPTGRRLILGTVEDVTTETYFHKCEVANGEMLRLTQPETDLRSVLSIISGIVAREFDSCRMIWMDHEMNELMSFVRPDMADTLPRLSPALRERLVGYMRPILNEKHGCAIQEIGNVPELASILDECPGYPHAQLGFEIFNRKQYIGTLFIQFMDRMTFSAQNLEVRMMMVNTFSAILYRIREQQSLEDSKRLLEQIIDALPMSLYVKDVNDSFRFAICNERFCRMIGQTKESVIGHREHDFVPKPVADMLLAEQSSVIETETPVHEDVEEDMPGVGWPPDLRPHRRRGNAQTRESRAVHGHPAQTAPHGEHRRAPERHPVPGKVTGLSACPEAVLAE